MSNLSNTHDVINYITGKTVALSGQRLAVVRFKTDKETGIKPDNKAVSIPFIMDNEIVDNLQKLLPAFGAFLQQTQDEIIRELVIDGKTTVTNESISIPAVINYLNAVASGNRISKEYLTEWFDNTASEYLVSAIASKLGITNIDLAPADKVQTLANTVETYKSKLVGLLGAKTVYSSEAIAALRKALSLIPVDKVTKLLSDKLDNMSNKPTEQLLAL